MDAIRQCAGVALVLFAVALSAAGCASHVAGKSHEVEQQRVAANLANFADLDLNVYTNQKWNELHRSHSKDVIVHWPDGRITKGIEPHIKDMQWTFTWAPDTRIKLQPVKVGQGDWTAVIGEMEGTFTRPMPMPDGTTIPPTGKAYKIRLATFAHWTKEGPMDEEYLFWDNQDFMRQIGLGK
ncbi:MAG: ester cyclase [Nitrospiraceae bacterium]